MVLSMDRWVGKVAIVTGASSGIGAAIAESLVKQGLQVAALARRKDRLEKLATKLSNEKGKLFPVKTDISKEEEVLSAFKWIKENLGPVHILVNNAGISIDKTRLTDGELEAWKQVYDVNVLGLCVATREAVKDMKTNNVDGHIIHINSILGHQVIDYPGMCVYSSTKFAVTALAETLRLELMREKSKIKITSVSPGLVDTEILGSIGINDTPLLQQVYENKQILDPEDIADGVVYVLSTPPHVQVAGLARRKNRLDDLAKKLSKESGTFFPVPTDISKGEEILKAFKLIKDNLGPIHILINNAGVQNPKRSLVDGDLEEWKKTLDINVLGLCIATREAVRDMIDNNVAGHIIHMNSVMGRDVLDIPGLNVYPATKFAVRALAETLRLDLKREKSKIKITNISPGVVNTELLEITGFTKLPNYKLMLDEKQILDTEDLVDGIVYILSTPPHVQISELTMRATNALL